jgi:2-alkyl-3-oxoalkanoate reductase
MRILVLGASGVLGRRVAARLVTEGHEVIGTSRSQERFDAINELGATPWVADVLDEEGIDLVLTRLHPEVVVHAVSDIPDEIDMRRYAAVMAGNDRVRAEGTPILMRAVAGAGVGRVITASVAFAYAPTDGRPATETDPLHLDAPQPFGRMVRAVATHERATLTATGVRGAVLRFGALYGPGTFYAPDGSIGSLVRAGRYPIAGDGDARTSFVHVEDAARATSAVLTNEAVGVFNIVDDEPARMRDWVPVLASVLGGPPPVRRPPGGDGTPRQTGHGASNAKARREIGWSPRVSSWREGFARQGSA